MKVHPGSLGWALVGGLSLVVACSGSSEGGAEPGGGAGKASSGASGASAGTSSAGEASGGSTARGGSSAGGTAGGATGGRASGGNAGAGGFNFGGEGFGGEGFDPSDFTCEAPPEVGAACDASAVPCLNGTDVCYCDMSEWACTSVLGGGAGAGGTGPVGNIDCPATKPMSGTPCGDTVGICPYGGGAFSGCACYAGSWTCT